MFQNGFHYMFRDLQAEKTVVLLHGTGGDEYDLLPLTNHFPFAHNILSIRGAVQENGMARFFERTNSGIFNQESIRTEAEKLRNFLQTFAQTEQLELSHFLYVGFSNGATMILALTFYFPSLITHAGLLHPMLPFLPQFSENDKSKFKKIQVFCEF